MEAEQGRWLRLFSQSFVPVVLVILGLFLLLLYTSFRAEFEADQVTTIEVMPATESDTSSDPAVPDAGDTLEPAMTVAADADRSRAEAALRQGRWSEAEQLFQAISERQPGSRALNDLGVVFLKKGDLPRALEYFTKAINTQPIDANAYFNRALVYSRNGRYREALADYRTVLELIPYHFGAQYEIGATLARLGDRAGAAVALGKAARLAGGERKARALIALGFARRSLNELQAAAGAFGAALELTPVALEPRMGLASLEPDDESGRTRALARYREVLELRPGYAPAYLRMAAIFNAQHKRREAEQAYRQAIQFDPDYKHAHDQLGLFLLAEKRRPEARLEFEWLLQHNPKDTDAHFNLGRIAYGEKDYKGAIDAYRAVLRATDGKYPEALLNLGLAYAAQKQYATAIASYQDALKLRRNYPEAWYNIGIAYLRQKQYDSAASAFRSAVRLKANYEHAWFNLGVVYGESARDHEAIDAYARALAIRPNYYQAQLNLAVRYARIGNHNEAVRLYRAILSQDDTYATAWFNLSTAYIATGQPAEAVAALRRVLALDPSDARALGNLGRALLLDHQPEEAVKILESAVISDTGNARLRLQLAQALRQTGRIAEAREELAKAKQLDAQISGLEQASKSPGDSELPTPTLRR